MKSMLDGEISWPLKVMVGICLLFIFTVMICIIIALVLGITWLAGVA